MNTANPEQGAIESIASPPDVSDPGSAFESIDFSDGCSRNSIFPKQLFLQMVAVERKRADRSGRCLVLMLVRSPLLLRSGHNSILDKVLLSMSKSKRDTDVTGWYQDDSILGVLFTEIAAGKSVVNILSGRVHLALGDVLTPDQFCEVKLSFHAYPDDCRVQDPGDPGFSALYPDLINHARSKHVALATKRCIDAVGGSALIILLLPLLLLIALAIKLTSRGSVVFRQKRLGQFGQAFTFLKFRSMYSNNDYAIHQSYVKQFIANQRHGGEQRDGSAIYKIQNDPRVTKIGAFLRRTSLDELPQLFNVLSGQMSLVGPRPPLPYEFDSYKAWHKCRLLAVKPGITGFWQVHGRSRVKFDEMVRMDLHYAKTWSLWLDIKILLQTPMAVLKGNGAC
jgi:lipopolysaccharide/colanic/teichoic acid biosynthesis glycosyltransferase